MSRQEKQQQGQQIEGTCITYVKPRDIWAEQGYTVDGGNNITRIEQTSRPNTPNNTQPERRPFWKR